MRNVYLILLFLFFEILTIILQSNTQESEPITPKTLQVLPYILNKKKNDQINPEKLEKQYTLLESATVIPNTHFHRIPNGYDNEMNNGRQPIDTTEDTTKFSLKEIALPKLPKSDWTQQHMPNFPNIHNTHGYNAIINGLRNYFAGDTYAPLHGSFASHYPAVPTTLLIFINLGLLSYILLAVLGLIHGILGSGYNGYSAFSIRSPYVGHENFGHGQFSFLRKAANDISSE